MIEDKISKIVESFGAKLYDIEIVREGGKEYFRVFVAKEGGVDLELCQSISKLLSPLLDVEYHSSKPYFLEVSSPGVERKLKKPKHFMMSIGELVKIKTFKRGSFQGILKAADEKSVVLEGCEPLEYEDIKSATTIFRW